MSDRYMKAYLPYPNASGEEMQIEVYYSLGGMNYWSGKVDPRGLWLSFTPVRRSKSRTGLSSVTSRVGDPRGKRFLLKEMKRKNAKQGFAVANQIKGNVFAMGNAAVIGDWDVVKALALKALDPANA